MTTEIKEDNIRGVIENWGFCKLPDYFNSGVSKDNYRVIGNFPSYKNFLTLCCNPDDKILTSSIEVLDLNEMKIKTENSTYFLGTRSSSMSKKYFEELLQEMEENGVKIIK